ncbi:hypothetical protein OHB05_04805 [Streptomyces sp. NBC_00638]|nr:hypothetical protein [Streptomyces sp. NBC_00638]MCX5001949.1 hypothetical protein [Streptomyces sp. NBC_00638]
MVGPTRPLDGVVDVVDDLTHRFDDRRTQATGPSEHGTAYGRLRGS